MLSYSIKNILNKLINNTKILDYEILLNFQ